VPDPQKHTDSRGYIESFLRYIPGFRGYLEKDYRQESDFLIRKYIADKIQASKRGLDDYMRAMVERAEIDAMPLLERVRTRLDKFESTIRSQVRGYSGFFDFVKVNVELLDKVYQHDLAMVDQVEALTKDLNSLAVKNDTPSDVANDLLSKITDAEKRFAMRGEMLQGLGD
jgi:hypothetical protein